MNKPSLRWQAVAGYVVDLYRFAYARLENPHSYYKFVQLNEVRKRTSADALVETGTYLGVTSYRCSWAFRSVYTVEIEPTIAASAAKFLRKRTNVKVYCGDATIEIERIFREGNFDRAVVFLDGHFSGGDTGCGTMPEPALEELNVLSKVKERVAAIVIDDFRSFGAAPGFPRKSELFHALEQFFPDYSLTISADQVLAVKP